jgi:hypothetical protein
MADVFDFANAAANAGNICATNATSDVSPYAVGTVVEIGSFDNDSDVLVE